MEDEIHKYRREIFFGGRKAIRKCRGGTRFEVSTQREEELLGNHVYNI